MQAACADSDCRARPSQAAKSRPLAKAAPLPIAATITLNNRTDARNRHQSRSIAAAAAMPTAACQHLDLFCDVSTLALRTIDQPPRQRHASFAYKSVQSRWSRASIEVAIQMRLRPAQEQSQSQKQR
jgi:hypothetical protein